MIQILHLAKAEIRIFFTLSMIPRRLFLAQVLLILASCTRSKSTQISLKKLIVGVVAYGEGIQSVEQYQSFINYLETQTKTLIELEPVYNEVQAIKQIQRQAWSLVFAPPGLAAIATQAQYLPLFPLQGTNNRRSVLVVLEASNIKKLTDLNGQTVALGQPGSVTGYYLPLYNLYGITLAKVQIAPTPKNILELIAKGEVAMGALSKDEFDRYQSEFLPIKLRILHASQSIPSGAVLVSPNIEGDRLKAIEQAMNQAIPEIAQQAGYISNAPPPKYNDLIAFIDKVKSIEAHIHEQPAPLYQLKEEKLF